MTLVYLLLVKVLDTHAVNTGAIFPGLVGLQSEQNECNWPIKGAVRQKNAVSFKISSYVE